MDKNHHLSAGSKTDIVTEQEIDIAEPVFYHVILLNDDYTPMNFVIEILIKYFQKNYDDAHALTMQVHHQQRAVAGTYPIEIAQEKAAKVCSIAALNDFPLRCITEPAQ